MTAVKQMKNFRKILLLCLLLGVLLIAGCGRSDVTLTANEDGSFGAVMNYRIIKSQVVGEETMAQTKSIVTSTLDENNIPYTETEDEEYVTITVERSFADINELTSAEAWRGISFVPAFVSNENSPGIWIRYEDGRLALSGTLDVDSFGARDIVTDFGTFGGSLRVVLPSEAESFSGGEADGEGYIWSGNSGDSISMDIKSQQIFSDLPQAQPEESPQGESAESPSSPKYVIIGLIVAAVLCVLAVLLIRKKNKTADKEIIDEEPTDNE